METKTLYEQVGGFDKVLALCRSWYRLCLSDPLAAHPFEHGLHPYHDERLAAYLSEAMGGPALYSAGYGNESHVQCIHAGNGVHLELDEACLACFDRAISETGISDEGARQLRAYFRHATEAMRRFEEKEASVPPDLPFNYAASHGA